MNGSKIQFVLKDKLQFNFNKDKRDQMMFLNKEEYNKNNKERKMFKQEKVEVEDKNKVKHYFRKFINKSCKLKDNFHNLIYFLQMTS